MSETSGLPPAPASSSLTSARYEQCPVCRPSPPQTTSTSTRAAASTASSRVALLFPLPGERARACPEGTRRGEGRSREHSTEAAFSFVSHPQSSDNLKTPPRGKY